MADLISIQGTVSSEKSKKGLAGIKVLAEKEGTQVIKETDKSGKYAFNLDPGYWRISIQASGFMSSEEYYCNFIVDTKELDFQLKEAYLLSGLVIDENNSQPAAGVSVKAKATIDGVPEEEHALSNYAGRYYLNSLKPGDWTVQGKRNERLTKEKTKKLGADEKNFNLTLSRMMTERDWRNGIAFFLILIILLGGLIWGYFAAHQAYPSPEEPELVAFSDQISQVLEISNQAIAAKESAAGDDADVEEADVDEADSDVGDGDESQDFDASMQLLRNMVSSIKESWTSISDEVVSISAGQNKQVLVLINGAVTAATNNDPQNVQFSINSVQSVIKGKRSLYLWSDPPMSYLEVLFWSLAGILVSVIISCGYYLRKKCYLSEGIWMHISHLLSMPILSLVVVFLISMVKFSFQIEGSEVILNINDPRVLVAISFIIAVRPWEIITFVQDAGEGFFDKLKKGFSGDDEEDKDKNKKDKNKKDKNKS